MRPVLRPQCTRPGWVPSQEKPRRAVPAWRLSAAPPAGAQPQRGGSRGRPATSSERGPVPHAALRAVHLPSAAVGRRKQTILAPSSVFSSRSLQKWCLYFRRGGLGDQQRRRQWLAQQLALGAGGRLGRPRALSPPEGDADGVRGGTGPRRVAAHGASEGSVLGAVGTGRWEAAAIMGRSHALARVRRRAFPQPACPASVRAGV